MKRTRSDDALEAAETAEAPPTSTATHSSDGSSDPISFEAAHVHAVYNAIAPHFSATRYKPWPRIQSFLQALPPYTFVADVGCGNGKYFRCAQEQLREATTTESSTTDARGAASPAMTVVAAHRYLLGLDYSEALLKQTHRSAVDPNYSPETRLAQPVPPRPARSATQKRAQERRAALRVVREHEELPRTDVVASDAQRCPLRGGIFDAVLSIAVVHHYATRARRIAALCELLRLARPAGGQVLVYVWAYEQSEAKQRARGVDPVTGDALVKWEVNAKFDPTKTQFHRYYHFFKQGELEALCLEAAQELSVGCRVVTSWYDQENWCVLLERTS